jgi:hypothetical protein
MPNIQSILAFLEKYQPILKLIEIITIVATLIFLSQELDTMNQDNKINSYNNKIDSFGQVYEQMIEIHKIFIEHPELRLYIYSQQRPENIFPNYKETQKVKKKSDNTDKDENTLFQKRKDYAAALAVTELMLDYFSLVINEWEDIGSANESWKLYIKDIYKCSPLLRERYKLRHEWYKVEIPGQIIKEAENELKEISPEKKKMNCDEIDPPKL